MSINLDFLLVLFGFVVRIVVPFVLVFGVLYLLKHWLEPRLEIAVPMPKIKMPFNQHPAVVAAVCLIAIGVIGALLYAMLTHQLLDLIMVFRDVVVLGYLFVLRIGLPLVILLGLGAWLERKLNPDAVRQPKPLSKRLPILQRVHLPHVSARAALAATLIGVMWLAALGITVTRFYFGIGYTTNLTDQAPWGIWIGFDVICGVALAAGGFVMAGTVHVFNIEKYHPIVRPAILTALLGYLLVIVGLMFDLGRWYNMLNVVYMWNVHSPLIEVAWCVMLYTTVLALEFSPVIFEKFKLQWPLKVMRRITIPLVILGMVLSTLHQSSIGTLFLIFPEKMSPLWYTPLLPVFFFLSAVAVGLGMTIVESNLSARALGMELESDLLKGLGRAAAIVLAVYLALKVFDLVSRGALAYLTVSSFHTALFITEIFFGVVTPMVILATRRGREHPRLVYLAGGLIVGGVVLNRLNTALLGWWTYANGGPFYVPSLSEITITVSLLTAGVVAFGLAAKFLPVFTAKHVQSHA